MRREAQAIVFVLLGAVLIKIVISGEYLNYVRTVLKPYLLLAGLVLMVLGAVGIVRDWQGRAAAERAEQMATVARVRTHGPGSVAETTTTTALIDAVGPVAIEEHDEHGHAAHQHTGAGHHIGWLWVLPVFVLILVPPPALGSFSAQRGAATVPQPAGALKYPALAGADPVKMEVNDYARRAIWNKGKTLTGHTIQLSGFVTPHNGGGWYLTRLKVSCCAADARPYQVEIDGYSKPIARDTWVQVTGVWMPSTGTNQTTQVARMKISVLDFISKPSQPYE
jgi:uncharacterized repeat protein (TIGR03943 family)